MELILRTRDAAGSTADVTVHLEPTHTVAELTDALCVHTGTDRRVAAITSVRTGRTLDPRASVADADVVSGDELVLGPAIVLREAEPLPLRAVTADVLAGPDSGTSTLLQPGHYTIGRNAEADLTIDDPSVSRHHAELDVGDDWSIVLVPDLDAANGVTVNDELITEPTPIAPDDVVGLGGSRLAFRPFVRSEHERHDRLGQIDFHRTPYRPPVVPEPGEQEIGPVPTRPDPRRFQVLGAVAPLAAGLTMFAFSKQVQFLALTLVSPVVMAANWFEERRSGRRKFSDELAEFRAELDDERVRLDELRHQERVDRLRVAPDLADLVRRSELRTLDLWPRGRDAPDFLHVRLGLGAAKVQFGVEIKPGGSNDLVDEAERAMRGVRDLDNVPVTAALAEHNILGIHGERNLVDGVVSSLAVQAATLHSPEDLTIAAALAGDRPLHWMKWFPHMRSVASPLPGNHLVTTKSDADALIARLTEVALFRTNGDRSRDDDRRWPRILLFVDGDVRPDAAGASRLLDLAEAAGISVVWLAESAADVPRQASEILAVSRGQGDAMRGRLWATDPTVADRHLEVEHLRSRLADRAARSLAPVRDASTASLATSIPRAAPLLDVLGTGRPTAQWVSEQWLAPHGYHLRFPIGIGADGIVEIDLVENGPHTLIGGTSGAGKSELLQSMVAALAVRHPPTRLNFLFVDYKGGASSNVFGTLPHTVGYVTNLSADLALRALTSLRAELNHRMSLMEGRAKDLAEMLDVGPDEAPASLVIIVDEFATLVKEVPEFVAGIIDIAQRGRSLGIHLVLATQRPSGSVNENILANTNLRVSLRMLDRAESTAIINSTEAADIPVPLRGRGFLRLGPRELVEFQSAYSSAPLTTSEARQPVLVGPFVRTDDTPRPVQASTDAAGTSTQLRAVIDAAAEANSQLHLPEPRKPWREVLPELVTLHHVVTDPSASEPGAEAGRHVVVGLIDVPEQQTQRPAVIDLETDGGWLVFGSGGSGKTTLLRTVATSIAASSRGDDVAVVAFDFASRGLMGLRDLPDVVDVASGDDIEAVTRHLAQLDAELERRRLVLADAGAENLTAYNRAHAPLPRIVVLIDGFDGFASTFMEATGGLMSMSMEVWADAVQRIVIDGRQVGIHTVITAARRNSVPSRIHGSISGRLILRHADENGYTDHGVALAVARGLDLVPGRGLLNGTTLVQIACVSKDPSARQQSAFVTGFASRLARPRTTTLRSEPLPELLPADRLAPATAPLRAPLGIADVTSDDVTADLEWSNLTVCGPGRSGRSTTVVTVAVGLAAHNEVFAICPTTSPLAHLDAEHLAVGRAADVAPLLERLANLVAMGPADRPRILVIDDVESFDDSSLVGVWEQLSELDDLRIVAAMETRTMTGYTSNPVVNLLRRSRRLLVLQPDDPTDFMQVTGIRLPVRPGMRLPPGRGVLIADRIPTVLHVAMPDHPSR